MYEEYVTIQELYKLLVILPFNLTYFNIILLLFDIFMISGTRDTATSSWCILGNLIRILSDIYIYLYILYIKKIS